MLVERDLDDHAVRGALNPEIIGIGDEIHRRMLRDDLEAIILRNIDGADHRFVNDGSRLSWQLAGVHSDVPVKLIAQPLQRIRAFRRKVDRSIVANRPSY